MYLQERGGSGVGDRVDYWQVDWLGMGVSGQMGKKMDEEAHLRFAWVGAE